MKYIDFHLHTTYSDGDLSPSDLVRLAKLNGMDAIAITDHDNWRGYKEASLAGKKWGIKVIPGVEITTDYHILGFGVNLEDKKFQEFLEESRELQNYNCKLLVDKMEKAGVPVSFNEVKNFFGEECRLGSGTLIRYLLGPAREYFDNLGLKSYYEVNHHMNSFKEDDENMDVKRVIDEIHRVGGIAIVAHPFKEIKSNFEERLDELVAMGIDGLEIQPNYGDKNKYTLDYAKRKGLIITYGSDYHGVITHRNLLDREYNLVEDSLVEGLVRD